MFPVEFDLCFGDKVFTYKAVSYEEKKRFLTALISLSDRTQMSGVRKISLNNLPADLVLDESNLKNKVDQDSTNKVSTVNSRFKKDLKLQIHLHKTFFSDDQFLDSLHKSFLNQTTYVLKNRL